MANVEASVFDCMESYFDVDTHVASYQTYRQNAITVLECASLLSSLAGVTKAGMSFVARKLGKSTQKVGKELLKTSKSGGRNFFKPDLSAEDAHSVFRRDPKIRVVNHYETFRPQTNCRNPNPWESIS